MSDSSDYNIYQIPDRLLRHLSTNCPNFKQSNYLKKFIALKSNADKIDFVFQDLKKYNLFPKFAKGGKDDFKAIESKETGNHFFGRGIYKEAWMWYTKSICEAKTPETASVAYANRSACLYKLEKFSECMTDIELALKHNYPENLEPKLILRRKNAQKLLRPTQRYHYPVPTIPDENKNALVQCAKDCVRIESNQEFGRHVVATKDIEIGEIISVETPYATDLSCYYSRYCCMCLEFSYNLIPCQNCAIASFCSEDCREIARNTCHKFECCLGDSICTYYFTSSHLVALKVAISAKSDYHNLDALTLKPGDVYFSNRYKEIHNLMTGHDKIPTKTLYERAVTAAVLYDLLQNTTFFNGPNSDDIKRVFKELLLRHLHTVSLNVLNIQTRVCDFFNDDIKFPGHGLYSFSSLYNHSCNPNIMKVHYGSVMVCRAINTIKKGQQCFISYGPEYHKDPLFFRQICLRRSYLFSCDCAACRENWSPDIDFLPTFIDLHMDLFHFVEMNSALSQNNVEIAHQYLPHLRRQWKRHERFEPFGNTTEIKQLIVKCLQLFGNRI